MVVRCVKNRRRILARVILTPALFKTVGHNPRAPIAKNIRKDAYRPERLEKQRVASVVTRANANLGGVDDLPTPSTKMTGFKVTRVNLA